MTMTIDEILERKIEKKDLDRLSIGGVKVG